jgi:hypothetical protein
MLLHGKAWPMSLSALELSLKASLGACARCVTLTGVFIVLSWAGVAVLGRAAHPSIIVLAAATLVAMSLSVLGVAHAAAFLARRVQLQHHVGTVGAAPIARAAGDCGCRGGAGARPGRSADSSEAKTAPRGGVRTRQG